MPHVLRLAVIAAGALALFGTAPAQRPKPRDLVIWGIAIGPETKGQDAVKREFAKRHPELNVRVLSMGAGNMDPQKLLTSIVGNVAPDVINQDRFAISDWASRGAFQSLDDLIARDRNDPLSPKPEQYYPATWEEATYEGKVYGIPTGADDRVLVWNRKIFNEGADELRNAGLDPGRAPGPGARSSATRAPLPSGTPTARSSGRASCPTSATLGCICTGSRTTPSS